MATEVYKVDTVYTVDRIEIPLEPLKIKYLREFMDSFEDVKKAVDDHDAISKLSECIRVAMKQFHPEFKTVDDIEDNFDIHAIYHVIDIAAGIRFNAEKEDVKDQATDKGASWESLDLAKLEAEVFEIGVWKNFEELELSLSMAELMLLLESKRELDYQEKKFFAAIQGVDLDKQTGKGDGQNAWEKMKAKVFSGGKTSDPNDITSFQGAKAQKAGFGVGMGLGYEDMTKK